MVKNKKIFSKNFQYLLIGTLILLINACAVISSPIGGPKDEIAPTIVYMSPSYQQKNFNRKNFVLVFDEKIEVQSLSKEITITPSYPGKVSSTYKKNKLFISFDSLFKEKTTYIITLGNAVKDITEKNINKDIKFVFATGDELDSMYIKGKAIDLASGIPVKNTKVGLFEGDEKTPKYVASTNSDGTFDFTNLPNKEYTIKISSNKSSYKSQHGELYGQTYKKIPTTVDQSTPIDIQCFKVQDEKLKLYKVQNKKNYSTLKMNQRPLKVSLLNDSTDIKPIWNNKNINFYTNKKLDKPIDIKLSIIDSSYQKLDTIIKVLPPLVSLGKRKTTTKINPQEKLKYIKNTSKPIIFDLSLPIINVNPDSILIESVKDSSIISHKNFTLESSIQPTLSIINLLIKEDYRITFKKGSLIDIYNDSIPTQSFLIKAVNKEDYGIIKGTILTQESQFILQMLNDKNEVEEEIINQKNINFTNVIPGKKQFIVIIDTNKNGHWDTGNITTNTPPENIIRLKNTVNIKKNWEIDDLLLEF